MVYYIKGETRLDDSYALLHIYCISCSLHFYISLFFFAELTTSKRIAHHLAASENDPLPRRISRNTGFSDDGHVCLPEPNNPW